MSDLSDRWLERARAGDREAFAALVRRHLPAVHEIVRATSKGRGVPGDLVRETFHRAWRGLAGLSPRAEFTRWLEGIARYVSRDAARRRKPFSVAISKTSREDARRERTFRILDGVPGDEREALLLRHLDGLAREDAAETLGISVEELDGRLRSARERLRGILTGPEDA
jgi:RNA polymerase sigma-70 factor (ECF subfamily)